MLRVVIDHFVRKPPIGDGRVQPTGRARIVCRAREVHQENLAAPRSRWMHSRPLPRPRDAHCAAPFSEVLDDTPQNYVRRLRLHRIRRELISATEEVCTVSDAARHWGIGGDMGRLSGQVPETLWRTAERDAGASSRPSGDQRLAVIEIGTNYVDVYFQGPRLFARTRRDHVAIRRSVRRTRPLKRP